tara:strand:+ start:1203 stop:1400 length:198 start_codon:yes stop_codon:yes gene_type:complete
MENKMKLNMFDELSFTDIFETFDEEYLTMMADKNPEQLKRMCLFLSLDDQIRKEKLEKIPKTQMN